MGELARQFDALTVRALSPDKRIRAVIKGRRQARISFGDPADFEWYDDGTTLCDQASEALNRVYAGLRQGRARLVVARGRSVQGDEPHWDATVRQMYAELDGTAIGGGTDDDLVRLQVYGLRDWRLRMRPGALDRITAGGFCSAVNGCVMDAYGWYLAAMRSIKTTTLGDLEPIPGGPGR